MKRNIASKLACLLVLFVAAIFVGAELPAASAQNSNSSTTGGDSMMQTMNGNMGGSMMGTRRRARRRARPQTRRRARRNMNANMSGDAMTTGDANMNANMSGDTTDASMSGDTQSNMNSMSGGMQSGGGSMPGMGTFGDVADLSGTYTGTINYAEGGMTGEATLTLTGNTFTITAGSATQSGTLSARSWPGYTALSMRFGETLPATIISTRAWHKGNSLRIQSVRGETRAFSFNGRGDGAGGTAMSGGGSTTGRRSRGRRGRGRRGRSNTMMATPDAPPAPTPAPGR